MKIVVLAMLAVLSTLSLLSQPVHGVSIYTIYTATPSLGVIAVAPFIYLFFSKYLISFIGKGQDIATDNILARANLGHRSLPLLFGFGLSFFLILGESFRLYDDLRLILDLRTFPFYLIGYMAFFCAATQLLIYNVHRFNRVGIPKNLTAVGGYVLDKRPILSPMIFLVLAWSPYLITHFPGSATWDATVQIEEYMGVLPWSQHHPIVSSLFYGILFHLGTSIYSENTNLGLFLITLTQTAMLSFCFAFMLYTMKKWSIAPLYRLLSLMFFAFNPWIAIQSQSIVKDVTAILFIAVFSIYMLELVHKLIHEEHVRRPTWIILVVFGILASLWRHPNTFIVILSLLPLLFLKQAAKQRLFLLASIAVIFTSQFAINGLLARALNAKPGQFSAALSIPFQQTARFVRDFPDEVTPEERAAIDAVFIFDNLANAYYPRLSDPVHHQLRQNNDGLAEYFRHWLAMGIRRPRVYIEATLSGSFGYFAPTRLIFDPRNSNVHFHNFQVFDNIAGIENIQNPEIRQFVRRGILLLMQLPVVSLFFQLPIYTWMILLCILILWLNRLEGYIFGFMPALWTIAVCAASPVNAYLRYFLPVYVMLPALLAYTLYALHKNRTQKTS